MPSVTLIVPLLNEEEGIVSFHQRVRSVNFPESVDLRILFVDDGSTDRTPQLLEQLVLIDPHCAYLRLSRNFGQQAAFSAGLDAVETDAAIMMDGDGQHPPELIPEMLRLWMNGVEIVRTQRVATAEAGSTFKNFLSRNFYKFASLLSEVEMIPSGPDFCLLSSTAIQAIRQYRESHRFLRGIVSMLGFPTATLLFTPDRRNAGETKFSLKKQIKLASDGLFSFSTTPLYFSIGLGLVFLFVALVELLILLASLVLEGKSVTPGWTSLMVVTAGGFGTTMILLGIIGIYVGKVFEQVKQRPIYLVARSSATSTSLGNLSRSIQAETSDVSKGHCRSDAQPLLQVK